MNIRICDYCSEKWPKHQIKMSRRPNDEDLYAELCDKCMSDFARYIIEKKIPAEYNEGPAMIQNFYGDTDRLKPVKIQESKIPDIDDSVLDDLTIEVDDIDFNFDNFIERHKKQLTPAIGVNVTTKKESLISKIKNKINGDGMAQYVDRFDRIPPIKTQDSMDTYRPRGGGTKTWK